MLTAVGYAKLQVVVDACSIEPRGPPITAAEHSHAVILQQALHHIPNHSTEFTTRNIAIRLGQQLADKVQHGCNNYAISLEREKNCPLIRNQWLVYVVVEKSFAQWKISFQKDITCT